MSAGADTADSCDDVLYFIVGPSNAGGLKEPWGFDNIEFGFLNNTVVCLADDVAMAFDPGHIMNMDVMIRHVFPPFGRN
ncbi:MAG: hypothetical protein BWX90_00114 [bacterium ADurb.Bin132]|nr:MAG: hypothetical protein BWX90_00114 [bacterium ADurb.Bin132]